MKIVVKGLDKAIKELKGFGEQGVKMISNVTQANANEISANAKTLAPSNNGKLRQSIHTVQINELNYKIVVGASYGAYVEFGTGVKVQVPAEMKDIAAQFKGGGGGSFEQGLKSIEDWCRSKGIDVKLAYVIFVSLLNKGMDAQPFLYPAFVKGRKQYVQDLEKGLEALIKKQK